jgi:hypothetical protein
MRAARLVGTIAVQPQKRLAVRSMATVAKAGATGGFTPAQLGAMAVNGVRPSEVKQEKTYDSLPRVKDILVNVTLVDFKGDQYKIVGRVGDTLM